MDRTLFGYTLLVLGMLGAQASFAKNGADDIHHHQPGVEDSTHHAQVGSSTDDTPHLADDHPGLGQGRHTAKLDDHLTASGMKGITKLLINKNKTLLELRVNLNYPYPALGIIDYDSAKLATLTAKFKAGTAYETVCELDFDRIKNGKAEYRLSLKQRRNTLQIAKGSCDGLTKLPVYKAGDAIAIDYENEDGSTTNLANGVL